MANIAVKNADDTTVYLSTQGAGTNSDPYIYTGGSMVVSNFPTTQAISVASLPLPSGAATSALQPGFGTAGTPSANVSSVQGVVGGIAQPISGTVTANLGSGSLVSISGTVPTTNAAQLPAGLGQAVMAASLPVVIASNQTAVPVSGTVTANLGSGSQVAISGTVPVSAASLPLPTGAATLAKQPALGTAGTPSTDVISIQGVTNGTVVPVSGTVTANLGSGSVVSVSASENHVGAVGGQINSIAASELTRPADTTAYAAKDVVSDSTSAPTLLTFTNIARVNVGSGYIVKVRFMTDQSTNVARFRLHLYHTAPTAINDNSPFTLLYANKANRIGYIDLPACSTEGTGSTGASAIVVPGSGNLPMPFVCASASRTIYGILETLDIFTPASGQKFYIELLADVN